jgi:ketosteroid isomerase-like protein
MTTFADVSEGVRATIAAYAQALDDGRTDDVVGTFCRDGAMDMGARGLFEGHDALQAAFAKWVPRQPQRHLVVNTLVQEWSESEATAVSDVVFLLRGDEGWAVQLVGRYRDVLRLDDGRWRFHRRTANFSS